MAYKLLKEIDTNTIKSVLYYESGNPAQKIIPFRDDNTDYQEYLEWVAAGNTPDPAD